MSLLDEIQQFVCRHYIQPLKNSNNNRVSIVSGDVHDAMNLVARMPAVCNALRDKKQKLESLCGASFVEEIRKPNVKKDSSTNVFVFEIIKDNIIPFLSNELLIKPKNQKESNFKPMIYQEITENSPDTRKTKHLSASDFEELSRITMSNYFGTLLTKKQTKGVPKTFDLVSSDENIVGDAKYFTMVRGEAIPPAKFSVISEYIWLLKKVPAKQKFLIFGNDRRVPIEYLKRYGHLVEEVEFFFLHDETIKVEKLN